MSYKNSSYNLRIEINSFGLFELNLKIKHKSSMKNLSDFYLFFKRLTCFVLKFKKKFFFQLKRHLHNNHIKTLPKNIFNGMSNIQLL